VGGSAPSQTFLTNLSQRAEEVGQEQQLHSTTHPKQKVKIKIKVKVKVKTGQWCRSSRTRGLNRSVVQEQQNAQVKPDSC
jgi:hypothetical protein